MVSGRSEHAALRTANGTDFAFLVQPPFHGCHTAHVAEVPGQPKETHVTYCTHSLKALWKARFPPAVNCASQCTPSFLLGHGTSCNGLAVFEGRRPISPSRGEVRVLLQGARGQVWIPRTRVSTVFFQKQLRVTKGGHLALPRSPVTNVFFRHPLSSPSRALRWRKNVVAQPPAYKTVESKDPCGWVLLSRLRCHFCSTVTFLGMRCRRSHRILILTES